MKKLWQQIVAIACLALGCGCAALQAHPQAIGALNCGLKAIQNSLPSILGVVGAALNGGSPDWAALAHIEETYGWDAVACAVSQYLSPVTAAAADPTTMRRAVNARIYLNKRLVSVR